jgi:hypothetical protein
MTGMDIAPLLPPAPAFEPPAPDATPAPPIGRALIPASGLPIPPGGPPAPAAAPATGADWPAIGSPPMAAAPIVVPSSLPQANTRPSTGASASLTRTFGGLTRSIG